MITRRFPLISSSARLALLLVGAWVFVGATPGALAQAASVTLQFEGQALDLDSGTLYPEGEPGASKGSGGLLFYRYAEADIHLSYNPHRGHPAVVFHNQITGVEIAFLADTPFAEVTDDDLLWMTFSAGLVDRSFGPDDTIVVKTDCSAYFKLGNPVVDTSLTPFALTFDYERLGTLQSRESGPGAGAVMAVASVPPGLSSGDWQQIRALLNRAAYRFESQGGTVTGSNPAHRLRIIFDEDGVSVASGASAEGAWQWGLVVRQLGYEGKLLLLERARPEAAGDRVEYRRGELVEWFINDERGLEQGFTLAQRPQETGEGPLVLRMASRGDLHPLATADASGITLGDPSGRSVLSYGGLVAWDARGQDLPARMIVEEAGLRLEIDDRSALYPIVIDPTIESVSQLLPSDGAAGDFFGGAVAVSGDTVVVGACGGDFGCLDSGSAYVFVREGTDWVEQQKLTSGEAGDCFGISVAIADDTVVVGARDGYGALADTGAAYVFERSGTTWGAPERLFAADGDPYDAFGVSVAISGQRIVVGANGDDYLAPYAGSAYVFTFDGLQWGAAPTKLTASDGAGGDSFGFAVSISGDTIAVGADGADAPNPTNPTSLVTASGKTYIFEHDGAEWVEAPFLAASDLAALDRFGSAVAASGQTVVVGSAFHDFLTYGDAGAAYVFVRGGTGWVEQQRLVASDAYYYSLFGSSVAVAGDHAVIGAPDPFHVLFLGAGSAYLYERDGDVWAGETKLEATGFDLVQNAGISVAIDGGTAVVGADGTDRDDPMNPGDDFGAAHVFEFGGFPSNTAPIAVCQDVTLDAGDDCTADASVDGGSSDPDGDEITVSVNPEGPYGSGITEVTLTVTDSNGAADSCTAMVSVNDTTPPELTVDTTPIIVTDLDCSGSELIELPAATADDNCGAVTVSNGYGTPSVEFAVGDADVTYTATDDAGNVATAVLPVTVLPFDGDADGSFCYEDCDDTDPTIHPGAEELCDAKDNNCDGAVDEGWPNSEGDLYPDACDNCPEVANDGQENWNGDALGDACQDFDQDGLLDETEIETANTEGCPYPDNADSDFDTLLDGEETDAGTDPCNADTDGDGVNDADDPDPTVPGVPGSWLEQELRSKAAHVRGLELQLFEGRTEVGQQARRTQLAARFDKASNGVRKANVVTATEMLQRARMRIDGEPSPGEFMVPSPEKTDLLEQTDLYLSLLEQM